MPDDPVILVTGGMGFIGSHLVRRLIDQHPSATILNVDMNNYAAANGSRFFGGIGSQHHFQQSAEYEPVWPPPHLDNEDRNPRDNLTGNSNHIWFQQNLAGCHGKLSVVRRVCEVYQPHYIYHLAAQSHVDRSIDDPTSFGTNVTGTQSLLEVARLSTRLEKFVYVSTDEVYGSLPPSGRRGGERLHPAFSGFSESHTVRCGNPYSASKAASEQFALAYHNTFGLPVVITRGCNTYGKHQYPEKFIPVVCDNLLHDRQVPIYGDGQQRRQWLHVLDHVDGLIAAAAVGVPGQIYNLAAGLPSTNLSVVELALWVFGKTSSLLKFVEDRPGHDRCYWICDEKAQDELQWRPVYGNSLQRNQALKETFEWYGSSEGRGWTKFVNHDSGKRLGLRQKESS